MKTLSGTELCPLNSGRGDTAGAQTGTKRPSSPPLCLTLPGCDVFGGHFSVVNVVNIHEGSSAALTPVVLRRLL